MAAALPMGSSDKVRKYSTYHHFGWNWRRFQGRGISYAILPFATDRHARYKKKARAKPLATPQQQQQRKLAINGEPWQRRSCRGVSPCRGHRGRRSPAAGVGVAAVLQKGVRDA